MRKLREKRHDRVYHPISRIAHRSFSLDADTWRGLFPRTKGSPPVNYKFVGNGAAQSIKIGARAMKTVLNIAVMIALCANTALVAADKTTAENDARNLMSNIVSSFESGDTRSIEKMVKDEKFRGSLLDMIRHSPRPLFLRLEMDSMLMAEPFIVRVRCYAHRSLFPQRPVMADFKLEKCDGQYAVAGYWCRLEEEMARLYDVAFPACREMAA